jgi:hypothetical protein
MSLLACADCIASTVQAQRTLSQMMHILAAEHSISPFAITFTRAVVMQQVASDS